MKVVIVGAGISGLTAAAYMHQLGHEVEVFETREQLGGNCADRSVEDQTRLHIYGPHILHTSCEKVWDFLGQFTVFNDYEHRVLADTALGRIPIPFNRVSEAKVGKLTDDEVRDLLFVDYSEKMWGRPWDMLPDVIKCRVPKRRDNRDCRYFTDPHQGMPMAGFEEMFNRMADGCTLHLNAGLHCWRSASYDLLIYTGLVDEFYNFTHGRLRYKTLDIVTRQKTPGEEFQAAVINQCNRNTYTRKADHSYWHSADGYKSLGLVTLEHPRDWEGGGDIPYYPIPFGADQEMADKYATLNNKGDIVFLGRLATYKYLNIDMAVLQALESLEQFA